MRPCLEPVLRQASYLIRVRHAASCTTISATSSHRSGALSVQAGARARNQSRLMLQHRAAILGALHAKLLPQPLACAGNRAEGPELGCQVRPSRGVAPNPQPLNPKP